jgi:hypothetical protein
MNLNNYLNNQVKTINTMKTIKLLSLALLFSIAFTSCSDDDDAPIPVNEEEVITTLRLTLTPQGGGNPVVFESRDLDGDGPDAPIVTTGTLSVNTVYNGSVEVLNELEDPIENKTTEIAEEDDEHQFFFQYTGGVGPTIVYNDQDANGNPIGLDITLTTDANGSTNTLTVILLHEPDKDAPGVSDGDPTNAGGETDIEVTFNFAVI